MGIRERSTPSDPTTPSHHASDLLHQIEGIRTSRGDLRGAAADGRRVVISFVAAYERDAVPVLLAEGQQQELELRVIPATR